jgi:hypothetical protein
MALKGVNVSTAAAENGGNKKVKAGNDKAAKTADNNGDPGIFTPAPFDPDFGPGFNPRFDGQFSWDLTSHNYMNYMFGLVNMFAQTLFNGFADPTPQGNGNGNGNNSGDNNNPSGGGNNNPSGNGGNRNPNDNTVGGLPPMFGNPGDGRTFQGQPGVGNGGIPVPPPYDPDLGPAFNPRFDGQYAWDLTSNNYLNLLLGGVNNFQNTIYGFPTTGNSTSFARPASANNNNNVDNNAGKDDKKPKKTKKK